MPEYVSRAVRENRPLHDVSRPSASFSAILALPLHEPGKFYADTFHAENPLGYPLYNPLYGYEVIAQIFRPGEQYFPEGVVAFTDAKFTINMLPENRIPYGGTEATRRHELKHIEREKESKPHDEAQINREVVCEMGLPRFPFPSYS